MKQAMPFIFLGKFYLVLVAIFAIAGFQMAQAEPSRQAAASTALVLPGGVTLEMLRVEGETFQMGRTPDEQDSYEWESPQHEVTLDYTFYLGKYEVTKAQWEAVMGTKPWSGMEDVLEEPDSPAVYINWHQAQEFVTALNAHLQDTGQEVQAVRLPSEAEWEFTSRAGTNTRYFWGDDLDYSDIDLYAWYEGNASNAGENYAHRVGQKQPNPWGFYDMNGNAFEWCQDDWHGSYEDAPTDGSPWGDGSAADRVIRGGSWHLGSWRCRSASRFLEIAHYGYGGHGLRLAWTGEATEPTPRETEQWAEDFGYANWYRHNKHIRRLADVNGDGRDDIVAFGDNGVLVALSTGHGFGPSHTWDNFFTYNSYWRVDKHPRFAADMNGDGMADAVGFGDKGVFVGFSTGEGFTVPQMVCTGFGYQEGWRVRDTEESYYYNLDTIWAPTEQFCMDQRFPGDYIENPRYLLDINGDGLRDIAGFYPAGVKVALNTGNGFFENDGTLWLADFGEEQYWRSDQDVRRFADVNGDGWQDVVGIGETQVLVALAVDTDEDGLADGFAEASGWLDNFTDNRGWKVSKHPRVVKDFDGDGRADLAGFGDNGIMLALSNGSAFAQPSLVVANFGSERGWKSPFYYPRWFHDMDGDGDTDAFGLGDKKGFVSLYLGGTMTVPAPWVENFSRGQGWDPEHHLRLLGDVDGDGLADIVGFGEKGVFVY